MAECALCPRRCGADRTKKPGACRVGEELLLGRAALHFGEEPCISGERGSGAVFFAGCPLGCVYCQNYALSRGAEGKAVGVERLAEIFRELEAQGAHNLNLVTGTQYVPQIAAALSLARPQIPVVWNSSGYETVETVRFLSKFVDVFLPDMKYALPETARRYSRAPDYPETAKAAILEMVRSKGAYELDENGLLTRGVLIRHLVLPGQMENTRQVLRWAAESFLPGEVLFSLMAQYTPVHAPAEYPELGRSLTAEEWAAAEEMLAESGIEDGFFQDLDAAGAEAIPAFDATGV